MAPNAVEPLLADARLAVARADLAGAQQKIDRAIAAQPKSAEALLAKAQLLRLKNDVPGAIAVLDELITDQPSVMQARLDRASLELADRQERRGEGGHRRGAEGHAGQRAGDLSAGGDGSAGAQLQGRRRGPGADLRLYRPHPARLLPAGGGEGAAWPV